MSNPNFRPVYVSLLLAQLCFTQNNTTNSAGGTADTAISADTARVGATAAATEDTASANPKTVSTPTNQSGDSARAGVARRVNPDVPPSPSFVPATATLLNGLARAGVAGGYKLLDSGSALQAGTLIETNKDTKLEIEITGVAYLRVGSRSRVKLKTMRKDPSDTVAPVVEVETGRAWVKSIGDGTENLALETPGMSLTVEGTAYAVRISATKENLKVFEGHVSAAGKKGEAWARKMGPGKSLTTDDKGGVAQVVDFDPGQNDEFEQWNSEQDKNVNANLAKSTGSSLEPQPESKPGPAAAAKAVAAPPPSDSVEKKENTGPQKNTQSQPVPMVADSDSQAPDGETDKPSEEPKPNEKDEQKGLGYKGGINVGFVTKNERQLTRISFQPEISFGPLGVGFDVELFLDGDGNILADGWEFDNSDQALESVLRKVYYVRLFQPGDRFYIRGGAIEGVTLDPAGLITRGWGNIANYPGQKLLGIHTQLNGLTPVQLNLEFINNSLQDWKAEQGGLVGARASFAPLAPTGIPFLKGFRLGATGVSDLNQYAGLGDDDGDGCPNPKDDAPDNSNVCHQFDEGVLLENSFSSADTAFSLRIDSTIEANESAKTKGRFKADDFSIAGVDYFMPIISTKLLALNVYGEFAFPWDNSDPGIDSSWGLVPIGAGLKVTLLTVQAQYLMLNGQFQAGHFDGNYEMDRVRQQGDVYTTKEQLYWLGARSQGIRQGLYVDAGFDLLQFANVGGGYTHLVAETGPADRSYSGRASVGESVLQFIPKLSKAEIFYRKDHVGRDINEDGEKDEFFEITRFSTYGYTVGVQMAGNMTVNITKLTSYSRDSENKLVPGTNFVVATAIAF